ncbi:RNA-directed DNA polymerase, eukaryota [Tanacetum coccineum]
MSDSSFSDSSDLDDIAEYEMIMEINNEDQDEVEAVPMRTYINRERDVAEERLMADYFGPHPKYPAEYFRRRYRMNRELFLEIVQGANNDITVLHHSPLFDDLLADNEPVAPYVVNGQPFDRGYYLADGIYPQWSTFVKSFTVARDEKNAVFKRRQKSARKDVERAFGVLQGRWRIIAQPARAWTVNKLRRIMTSRTGRSSLGLGLRKGGSTNMLLESWNNTQGPGIIGNDLGCMKLVHIVSLKASSSRMLVDVTLPAVRDLSGRRAKLLVNNLDRLIENLNTIWIGRFHLFANPVRYERPNAAPIQKVFVGFNDAAPGFRQPKSQERRQEPFRALDSYRILPLVVEIKIVNSDITKRFGEAVFDTTLECINDNLDKEQSQNQPQNDEAASLDPFNIYPLLNKKHVGSSNIDSDNTIPFPPGFTPVEEYPKADDQVLKDKSPGSSYRHSEGFCSRVMEECQQDTVQPLPVDRNSGFNGNVLKKGGSILEVLDGMVKVGQAMGYDMGGCLGSKAKKDWTRELVGKYKVNFLSLQETKMEDISSMDAKFIWGNSRFEHITSNAIGNSGGILCIWDPNIFLKDQHTISDNFVAISGTWIPSNSKLLIISIYAPQSRSDKRLLWGYISSLISRWQGDSLVLGDFNEVRSEIERRGSVFNVYGAADFNDFISNAGLIDIQLEGYSFTWSHPSACKISKLDRFLVTEGFFSAFPHCSAICLDRHLSDHRPILLREVLVDYGATPFRFYHSWLSISGFDLMVSQVWKSFSFGDSNDMIRFKKKLQALKVSIRDWVKTHKKNQMERRNDITLKLVHYLAVDQGDSCDILQKAKIKWAIEGDENSKFFHGVVNRKRANLAIKGIMVDGDWVDIPSRVKDELCSQLWLLESRPILSSGKASILVNGSPTSEFQFHCGLKQGSSPIYRMSIYKVPKAVLASMEALRRRFFYGALDNEKKISWIKWSKFFRLKKPWWSWDHCLSSSSIWNSIVREVRVLKNLGVDLVSYCVKRVGNGLNTGFWDECWTGDKSLRSVESQQLSLLNDLVSSVSLSNSEDRWVWNLKGNGLFRVCDIRNLLDEKFLPKVEVATRWICNISYQNQIFALGRFIKAIYGEDGALNSSSSLSKRSSWLDIIRKVTVLHTKDINLLDLIRKKVGNRLNTLFWEDPWLDDLSLKHKFSRLNALDNYKQIIVVEKINHAFMVDTFRRPPKGDAEEAQLGFLLSRMDDIILTNIFDRWVWSL